MKNKREKDVLFSSGLIKNKLFNFSENIFLIKRLCRKEKEKKEIIYFVMILCGTQKCHLNLFLLILIFRNIALHVFCSTKNIQKMKIFSISKARIGRRVSAIRDELNEGLRVEQNDSAFGNYAPIPDIH